MQKKIQTFQNEVNFLKQKLKNLENTLESQTLVKKLKSSILLEANKIVLNASSQSDQYN